MNKVNSAAIYLGSDCNANCKYCHRESDKFEPNLEMIINTIDHFKVSNRIRLLGGEPLRYMNFIRELVPHLKQRKLLINLGTNGILLSRYVDEINELGISVTISYDGLGQDLRGISLNEDALSRVHDLQLCSVLSNLNCDLSSMVKSINNLNRKIKKNLIFTPYLMHLTNATNREYSPSINQIKRLCEEAKSTIDQFINYRRLGLDCTPLWGIYHWVARMIYQRNYTWGETYCVNKNNIKLDNQGNLISCLYIRDQILDFDNWQEQQATWMDEHLPKCKTCECYPHCGGGCIKSNPKIECIANKIMIPWFKEEYGNQRFIPLSE